MTFSITQIGSQIEQSSIVTTIAVASNGATLPQGTINVASTTGFTGTGSINVVTSSGIQAVAYTGVTGTTFTGCTGGGGSMSTGGSVWQPQNGGTDANAAVFSASATWAVGDLIVAKWAIGSNSGSAWDYSSLTTSAGAIGTVDNRSSTWTS